MRFFLTFAVTLLVIFILAGTACAGANQKGPENNNIMGVKAEAKQKKPKNGTIMAVNPVSSVVEINNRAYRVADDVRICRSSEPEHLLSFSALMKNQDVSYWLEKKGKVFEIKALVIHEES
ncbi:MAG: hypothetical protein JXK94_13945 [Deltaproteobacteria bacterium]|nr:hypothetical protein [Deltaproteobacteria bacterium]